MEKTVTKHTLSIKLRKQTIQIAFKWLCAVGLDGLRLKISIILILAGLKKFQTTTTHQPPKTVDWEG